ncbi:MAG TPA: biopolymer transporter ExbD [Polyangiaceae bacterium]|jgi:biopolymer transport protein ExbD|nr:biopolymer transporter ExbD [Polyangiaceae bacterium]
MASVTQSRGGSRGGIVGINVTPMVDVVLVLLVIMMVSATYIVSQSLKVELPKTATSDEQVARTYVVTITKDGKLLFNDAPVTKTELPAKLRAAKASSKEVSLVITADEFAYHGQVVGVIDAAKLEGITKFAINVERSK